MFPYTLTPTSLNVLFGGRMRTINNTHAKFDRAVDLVKTVAAIGPAQVAMDELEEILDIRKFVARITHGRVQVGADEVRIDGRPAHGYAVTRLLEMIRADFDVTPMVKFIDKLQSNPTADVREDMWKWLEAGGMPLCEDGDFIAFKKVNEDFYDFHSESVFHGVGTPVSMPRELCDDNRNNTCSRGLHFCSYEYLDGYKGSRGHVLVLKIDPANVVAIPREYSLSKGRACAYYVHSTIPQEEAARFFDGQLVAHDVGCAPDTAKAVIMTIDPIDGTTEDEGYDQTCDACGDDACDEGYCEACFEDETGCNCDVIADADEPDDLLVAKGIEGETSLIVTHGDKVGVIVPDNGYAAVGEVLPDAIRVALNGDATGLATGFVWDTAPQGWAYWHARSIGRTALSDGDRAWLQGLADYVDSRLTPDWITAMRRD